MILRAAVFARLLADDECFGTNDRTDRRVCDQSGCRINVERNSALQTRRLICCPRAASLQLRRLARTRCGRAFGQRRWLICESAIVFVFVVNLAAIGFSHSLIRRTIFIGCRRSAAQEKLRALALTVG